MTIASEITRIQTNIANAYTAASGKGATIPATENSDNLATCIASIPSGGGSGKYQLLERVKDDNNNEIGTVSGFFTDANNVEYAVVCLDAQYRLNAGNWMSQGNMLVTDLPSYQSQSVYSATETATFNTQKILDFCTAGNYTSAACNHCRSKSFTIDGTTYYGQLLNVVELVDILRHRPEINTADTSASSYSSLVIPDASTIWTSTQGTKYGAWSSSNVGYLQAQMGQINQAFVAPVLEIPNA